MVNYFSTIPKEGRKMRKKRILTRKGKRLFFIGGASALLLTIMMATAMLVHNQVTAIRADGGYFAVGEKTNEFGLPSVVKKPLR